MDGRALAWFQWMTSNGQLTSWPVFLQALHARFAQSQYEDPTGALFKLTQKGTVGDYLAEFEDLATRVVGLPPPFLLSCFVSGLSPDIRRDVQAMQPLTLAQAAGLAKLQKEKFLDHRLPPKPRNPAPTTQRPFIRPSPPTPSPKSFFPTPISTAPAPLLTAPPRTPPPVKRLSPEEVASRWERGLCFSCDEKYHRGHKCASRVFLIIAAEDDPPLPNLNPADPDPDPPDPPDINPAQISLNTLAGNVAPEMLHLVGIISDHHIILLVDGGNTHSFIQEQLVTQLRLPCQDIPPLRVMIGNGQHLVCSHMCPRVSITIQGAQFTVDLYVLPIAGANVVLGVQWLKSLGPILTDYTTLCMQFFHEGRLVQLNGDRDASLHMLTLPQFRRFCRRHEDALYLHVSMTSSETPQQTPTQVPSAIKDLLTHFASLFQEPHSLPPPRETDHHIHLLPHSSPVNVRPYRYPHFQKREIELQVELMLQKGLIQPSTSPFSSPVLLVRKQDGS
ncbi:uncharacterized protein [Glycine max]|uniref:uncharacterized protein n=1 Tax=Glycine max TaxID=3847 RepID=UPI001B35740A|nr:uncharacterized protein LOC121175073 [Glycine max]